MIYPCHDYNLCINYEFEVKRILSQSYTDEKTKWLPPYIFSYCTFNSLYQINNIKCLNQMGIILNNEKPHTKLLPSVVGV